MKKLLPLGRNRPSQVRNYKAERSGIRPAASLMLEKALFQGQQAKGIKKTSGISGAPPFIELAPSDNLRKHKCMALS